MFEVIADKTNVAGYFSTVSAAMQSVPGATWFLRSDGMILSSSHYIEEIIQEPVPPSTIYGSRVS